MKNTMRKVGGTVAMFALALSATGALAHGSDVKSHDPRQAVAMEEVVLVSKDGVLAGETTGQGGGGGVVGCGFVSTFIGNVAGNLLGNTSGIINLLGIAGGSIGNCNIQG